MIEQFDGFTDQQYADIRKTLAPYLKSDATWDRIRFDISVVMADLYDGPCDPARVMCKSKVARQTAALTQSLEAALQAHDQQAKVLQWHQNDQQDQIVGFGESGEEWARLISQETGQHHCPQPRTRCYTVRQLVEAALTAVRRANEQPNPHVLINKTKAKNRVMRLAVRELMDIFETATRVNPTVYAAPFKKINDDTKIGVQYSGTFYPFAVACLTPVFPDQELSSAILTAYTERRDEIEEAIRKAKSPQPVT